MRFLMLGGLMCCVLAGCAESARAPEPSPGLNYAAAIKSMSSPDIFVECSTFRAAAEHGASYGPQEQVNRTCKASLLALEAISRENSDLVATCTQSTAALLSEYKSRFPGSDPASLAGKC